MYLSEEDLPNHPMDLFEQWYQKAVDLDNIKDANKMVLSTVDDKTVPDSRYVLLKYYDREKLRFFTNTKSTKANQILDNPNVAVNFLWDFGDFYRQVRIRAKAQPCDESDADAYFSSRSRESQIGAWASLQSQPLGSRNELEERYEMFKEKFEGRVVPRPRYWSGFDLYPRKVEFWETGEYRLHDRFIYSNDDNEWIVQRYYP